MGQVLVESFNHSRRSPFLRTIDCRGAVWAAQGVGDVASHGNLDTVERVQSCGPLDAGQSAQVAATGVEVTVLVVELTEADGLSKAATAVIARAAADADNHSPRSRGNSRQQQFAGSPRRRDQ